MATVVSMGDAEAKVTDPVVEERWRQILTGTALRRRGRHINGIIPARERCRSCHAPFTGVGRWLLLLWGQRRYSRNPRFCNFCFRYVFKRPGGAEVELSYLFVDVRGSTAHAEEMSTADFSRLMNEFYAVATDVLIKSDAFIDKIIGDEVMAIFIPAFTGPNHARPAVQAASQLLSKVEAVEFHGKRIQVGVGVHTGRAFFGTVGGAGGAMSDLTALGDSVNVAARLASAAEPGEALISEAAREAGRVELPGTIASTMKVRGRRTGLPVRVLVRGTAVVDSD
jgi:adenylate cyclase